MSVTLSRVSFDDAEATELSYQDIALDKERRRQFSAWAFQHAGLLNSTLQDLNLAGEMTNLIYLVDADVIRNLFLTPDQDPRRRREAMQFLSDADISFALPAGAFREILSWVRGLAPNRSGWADEPSLKGRTPKEAIKELRDVFAVHYSSHEDSGIDKGADDLFTAMSEKRLIIECLDSLFSQRNFKGVMGDYHAADEAAIDEVIKRLNRPRRKRGAPRSEIDHRDAINLSILCGLHRRRSDARRTQPPKDTPFYILVTQTRILLELFDEVNGESWELLSSLFGEQHKLPKSLYPVVSPQRAFMVEEVRRSVGLRNEMLKSLNARAFEFNDLGILLNEGTSSDDAPERLPLATAERLRELVTSLTTIYVDEPSIFREIEKQRSLEMSLRYFERAHRTDSTPGETLLKHLKSESESFFRVLSEFEDTVAKKSNIRYSLEHMEVGEMVQRFVVTSDKPHEVVLQGEIYQADSPSGTPYSWSARWATRSTERDFFSSVDSMIRSQFEGKSRQKNLSVQRAEVLPDKFEGLLVFTNSGVFSASFEQLPRGWGLKQMRVSRLLTAVAACMEGSLANILISAIRVVTRYGDFQMDVIVPDVLAREVFVVSHLNLSKQVTRLCMDTSMFPIMPLNLNNQLAELLYPFPSASTSDSEKVTA